MLEKDRAEIEEMMADLDKDGGVSPSASPSTDEWHMVGEFEEKDAYILEVLHAEGVCQEVLTEHWHPWPVAFDSPEEAKKFTIEESAKSRRHAEIDGLDDAYTMHWRVRICKIYSRKENGPEFEL